MVLLPFLTKKKAMEVARKGEVLENFLQKEFEVYHGE